MVMCALEDRKGNTWQDQKRKQTITNRQCRVETKHAGHYCLGTKQLCEFWMLGQAPTAVSRPNKPPVGGKDGRHRIGKVKRANAAMKEAVHCRRQRTQYHRLRRGTFQIERGRKRGGAGGGAFNQNEKKQERRPKRKRCGKRSRRAPDKFLVLLKQLLPRLVVPRVYATAGTDINIHPTTAATASGLRRPACKCRLKGGGTSTCHP